jgi:hypothetical protein
MGWCSNKNVVHGGPQVVHVTGYKLLHLKLVEMLKMHVFSICFYTNGKFIQTAHSLQEDNLNDDNPIVTELIFRACAVCAGKKQER